MDHLNPFDIFDKIIKDANYIIIDGPRLMYYATQAYNVVGEIKSFVFLPRTRLSIFNRNDKLYFI